MPRSLSRGLRWRFGFLAFVALMVLSEGCDGDGTGLEEEDVYFPLTVGSQWTYAPPSSEYGTSFDWRVTARSGDTVTVERPEYGSRQNSRTLLDHRSTVKISLEEGEFAILYRFTPGASWIRTDPWECDDGSEWAAVRETEAIQTPAGTFTNTIRLERRSEANCTDAGTMMEWWAPGVGLVAWDELNYYAGGPLRYSLQSFDQPSSAFSGR